MRARIVAIVLLVLALLAPAGTQAQGQKLDEGYTKKIREYTTEKFFLTELVDHLPASETVPTPEKVLGYAAGTPEKLTYTKEVHRYFRALEKASPRVKVFDMGRSEEGKETLLVAIAAEETIRDLPRWQDITAKLADPRKVSPEEAERLIGLGKPIYWANGAIHSTETGSPEMLMELGYRLAVSDAPPIRNIRERAIVLITPVLEVDGRDRMVDLYYSRKKNPDRTPPNLIYWGKYVAHDNNRDQMALSLALSRHMMRAFLQWHPTVLHDLHESVPFLYTSTGTGPYNAWLDPIVIDEWHALAWHEVEEMTRRGVPGVWTHGFYDGWAPNYMFYVANGHNSIGRFYETFGGRGADTETRTVGTQAQRAWYRPNPPLSRVRWSIRNNVNLQQSALLLAMDYVATNKERFLRNFYLKSRRSVEKARAEGPAAWVIPADNARPHAVAELVNLLQLQGVEVHAADGDFEVKAGSYSIPGSAASSLGARASLPAPEMRAGSPRSQEPAPAPPAKFPKGSYVIRMDQPYSRMADMLLDTQYYNANDPRPYDDTGWTLGPLKNVRTARVTDAAVLDVPMTLMREPARPKGGLSGPSSPAAYLINHNADNNLMTLRFRLMDLRVHAAEHEFKVGDRSFNAGTFVIKRDELPDGHRERLEKEAAELGVTVVGVEQLPEMKTHPVKAPRIAILHTWQNTQTEGWFRIAFDQLDIPYHYISEHVVRDTPNLKEKFDVILFPPVGGSAQSIVRGNPMRGEPIPWKGSELTPNWAKSPDTTDDIRGGMGLRGILNLQRFLEEGGVIIPIPSNPAIPIDYGLTEGVTIQQSETLQTRGSVFRARFADRRSPIAYGYEESMAVYFSQAPLFQVSLLGGLGGRGGGGGRGAESTGRPTGRGSLTDPDVPQGRPQAPPREETRPGPDGEERLPEDLPDSARRMLTPLNQRPRVVLRFAQNEPDLLISGMLAGGTELANRPAVVDIPVGKGHVVFFANNPMWRHQTQGSFFLLFNAALHFDHLGVGRPQPRE